MTAASDGENLIGESLVADEFRSTDRIDGHRVAKMRTEELEDGMNARQIAKHRDAERFNDEMGHKQMRINLMNLLKKQVSWDLVNFYFVPERRRIEDASSLGANR